MASNNHLVLSAAPSLSLVILIRGWSLAYAFGCLRFLWPSVYGSHLQYGWLAIPRPHN
jgi:hypothetical protein